MSMRHAYLVDGTRTPIGRYGGALSTVRPDDLAAHVLRALAERLDSVDSNLPGLMWIVVLFGAVITIAMTFLFWTESRAFHVFLNMAFAITLGLVIFLIVALDRPLVGSVSVPPTSFQELEDMMGPG